MNAHSFNSRRLDTNAFARAAASLAGESALVEFPRLCETAPSEDSIRQAPPVRWQALGSTRARSSTEPECWLHLSIEANVPMSCQRCLAPMQQPLSVDHSFRFLPDEASAAEEDMDAEEDLLVASHQFDLLELIEEELLLAAPIVPMHDDCPEADKLAPWLTAEDDEREISDDAPASGLEKRQPFAVLAQLKRKPGGGS